jgi:hypothetical protein
MFCSRFCRDAWETDMRDLAQFEEDAIPAALPAVGAYVASVGMEKPLKDYTKDEVIGLIRAAYVAVRETAELNDDVPF